MTITLYWWMVPTALVLMAILWLYFSPTPGDWDFMTPVVNVAVLAVLLIAAVFFTIGYLFA